MKREILLVGHASLHWAAIEGHEETVRVLVELGANIEARDTTTGSTPLHLAAIEGHEETVRALVELGANIEARDTKGQQVKDMKKPYASLQIGNAHLYIGQPLGGHEETVRVLVELGANIEARDTFGSTPLHLAAGEGHEETVRVLVESRRKCQCQEQPGTDSSRCGSERSRC